MQISGPTLSTPLLVASTVAACRSFPGGTGEEACQQLSFAVDSGDLPAGTYRVALQNPGPVACSTSPTLALTVVPAPTLSSLTADLACTAEGSRTLTLAGTGFLEVTGLPDGGSLSPIVNIRKPPGRRHRQRLLGPGRSCG